MRLLFISFVLSPLVVAGQIDIEALEKKYGKGEVTLKKDVSISFHYDEELQKYTAKATFNIQSLFLSTGSSDGLLQIPFNAYQDLKLKSARYFRIDSTGAKKLIENVKVKYADTKDYFIRGIFYHDLKVKQFRTNVELEENYCLNYSYEITYNDLKFLTTFYLQEGNDAVEKVKISIKKTPDVDISVFEFHHGSRISKSESEQHITYKGESLNRYKTSYNSVNGSYFLPHIIVSVSSVTTDKGTEEVLKSAKNLYDWYHMLIDELTPSEADMKELVSSFLKPGLTEEEKISAIFEWVQQNVQYVAFEDGIAGFKPAEAAEVANSKYGDCKGIANLLVNLLRSQGFDAQHAWIGTRSKDYSYSCPSLVVDNHMICALNFRNQRYFLDGTSKTAIWQLAPSHLEGKEVMVAQGDNYIIDTIKTSAASANTILISGKIDLEPEVPSIVLKVTIKGHFKRRFISSITYWSVRTVEKAPYYFMRKYLNGIDIESFTEPVYNDDGITFSILGTYRNYARNKTGTTLFPLLHTVNYKNLKADDAPTYISFPHQINVEMDIQEGNLSVPKSPPGNRNFGNDRYSANLKVQQVGTSIKLRQNFTINALDISSSEFEQWNNFLDEVHAFDNLAFIYGANK